MPDWSHHALLVIDVQNDFLNDVPNPETYRHSLEQLLSFCRTSEITVYHLRVSRETGFSEPTWTNDCAPPANSPQDQSLFRDASSRLFRISKSCSRSESRVDGSMPVALMIAGATDFARSRRSFPVVVRYTRTCRSSPGDRVRSTSPWLSNRFSSGVSVLDSR